MADVKLDYANFMDVSLDGGLPTGRWSGPLSKAFASAHAAVQDRRARGDLGFYDLPHAEENVMTVLGVAEEAANRFDDVVVLGIGGSGLGAIALREAIHGPGWNLCSPERRMGRPRLHVVDNPDPHTCEGLLARLDPDRTLFNVVSKSGSTAETMALYLVARGWLRRAIPSEREREHFVFTTDPNGGPLREIGSAEGVAMLPLPQNVGGRFSVLSPVGLFPAAMAGIDVRALLRGAGDMAIRCADGELTTNPAGVLATLLYEADATMGRPIHVFMPYADRLRAVGRWFQQLWAESLGKARSVTGEAVSIGPTPLASIGPTDQHSLLQLLMEGPHDKAVIFVGVDDKGDATTIPDLHASVPSAAYLAGHSLGSLLDAEQAATAEALRQVGRPSMTIRMPSLDPEHVGGLLMMLQIATVYCGALHGVDPLDQPGVELSKELTYGMLGRVGYDVPPIPEVDPRWVV